jgi:hypothetical protein
MFIYDESYVVSFFKEHYGVLGYDVQTAETIKEGISQARGFHPEVIVSDLFVSYDVTDDREFGFGELLDFVDEELPETKVILLTAIADNRLYRKVRNRVFAIYTKPTTYEEISAGIEEALGIRRLKAGDDMLVNPIWRGRGFVVEPKSCFVLMPFGASWSRRIWERHLGPIIAECGFTPRRADEFTGHDIMEDIWLGLNTAEMVIADITDRNANVFYELGIAHTLGKPIILLTQNIADVPFDVNRYRVIEYEDNSDGYDKLARLLPTYLASRGAE